MTDETETQTENAAATQQVPTLLDIPTDLTPFVGTALYRGLYEARGMLNLSQHFSDEQREWSNFMGKYYVEDLSNPKIFKDFATTQETVSRHGDPRVTSLSKAKDLEEHARFLVRTGASGDRDAPEITGSYLYAQSDGYAEYADLVKRSENLTPIIRASGIEQRDPHELGPQRHHRITVSAEVMITSELDRAPPSGASGDPPPTYAPADWPDLHFEIFGFSKRPDVATKSIEKFDVWHNVHTLHVLVQEDLNEPALPTSLHLQSRYKLFRERGMHVHLRNIAFVVLTHRYPDYSSKSK